MAYTPLSQIECRRIRTVIQYENELSAKIGSPTTTTTTMNMHTHMIM